jgi:hypothetical protein
MVETPGYFLLFYLAYVLGLLRVKLFLKFHQKYFFINYYNKKCIEYQNILQGGCTTMDFTLYMLMFYWKYLVKFNKVRL